MMFLGLLLASLPAWAEPTSVKTSDKLGFTATFRANYIKVAETDGTAYGWESKTSPVEGELVYLMSGKQKRTLSQMRKYLGRMLPSNVKVLEDRKISLAGHQGFEIEGLNANGIPFIMRAVVTPTRSLFYGAESYDTAQNRAFVSSFRLR
jgi:hypothetical protein